MTILLSCGEHFRGHSRSVKILLFTASVKFNCDLLLDLLQMQRHDGFPERFFPEVSFPDVKGPRLIQVHVDGVVLSHGALQITVMPTSAGCTTALITLYGIALTSHVCAMGNHQFDRRLLTPMSRRAVNSSRIWISMQRCFTVSL